MTEPTEPSGDLPRAADLIATSAADDAAFEALLDVARVIDHREESVVIGGHMVGLICAAFPAPGFIERRTQDADAGIPTELASSGELHDELLALGYSATAGNRYVKGEGDSRPTIDLLVPAVSSKFGEERRGGRRFDAMPGLGLAVNPTVRLDVGLAFQNGDKRRAHIAVPCLEAAVILKSFAWADRRHATVKDALDLSNLFAVVQHHGPDAVGGRWRLREAELQGLRREAAMRLHQLADAWDNNPPEGAVDARALVSRIRTWVTAPLAG